MNSSQFEALVQWIAAHPVAAGAAIFAAAFCDALLVIGAVVPAIPLFFAVGTLVGLGSINGPYAIACAALGAFCGDGLSYLIGRRYGDGLRGVWPFSRHPEWLERGAGLFERHGLKGILIARYVGAVRPFVPAIAGMLQMPGQRYALASAVAGVSWAALFIVPGWLFGAALESIAAIAGRLAIVLLILLTAVGGTGWLVYRLYGALAPRAAVAIERGLRWSQAHPRIGGLGRALIDPQAPESISLALMAVMLLFGAVSLLGVSLAVASDAGWGWDQRLRWAALQLRSPLADPLMAQLLSLASWVALVPATLAMTLFAVWLNGWRAAAHWLAALGFGLLAGGFLASVNPASHSSDAQALVVAASSLSGFFAIALARELPGRLHAWPYVVAGGLLAGICSAQLYFGLQPASQLLIEALLGLCWAAVLGLAYRRHTPRRGDLRAATGVFAGLLLVGAGWHAQQRSEQLSAVTSTPPAQIPVATDGWWTERWSELPAQRIDLISLRRWPLNLQFAGHPKHLQQALTEHGWQVQRSGGWAALLSTLNAKLDATRAPLLGASHRGQSEALVMYIEAGAPDRRWVLRLWSSDWVASDGARIYQGLIGESAFIEHAGLIRAWTFQGPSADSLNGLRNASAGFRQAVRTNASGSPLLLLHDTDARGE